MTPSAASISRGLRESIFHTLEPTGWKTQDWIIGAVQFFFSLPLMPFCLSKHLKPRIQNLFLLPSPLCHQILCVSGIIQGCGEVGAGRERAETRGKMVVACMKRSASHFVTLTLLAVALFSELFSGNRNYTIGLKIHS